MHLPRRSPPIELDRPQANVISHHVQSPLQSATAPCGPRFPRNLSCSEESPRRCPLGWRSRFWHICCALEPPLLSPGVVRATAVARRVQYGQILQPDTEERSSASRARGVILRMLSFSCETPRSSSIVPGTFVVVRPAEHRRPAR